MSDNDNNKSPDKMKNVKKSKSRRNKIRSKDNLKIMNTTLSTPNEIEILTTNKRRKSKMNDSFSKRLKAPLTQLKVEKINHLKKIFEFLTRHELLRASQVCSAWNKIAMSYDLWQTVCLKNSCVYDWNKAMATFQNRGTDTLDTRKMLIPTKIEESNTFWSEFSTEIKKAQKLKYIELYRCPTSVVEDIMNSLPQLIVLNATSIKNPVIKTRENQYVFMTLDLQSLSTLEHLTELSIKSFKSTGIQLTNLPSFENLVNLKYLSITSIKGFPNYVCQSLKTVSTNLVFLEIGDCDKLPLSAKPKDFAGVLKRLTNLTLLRLENYDERFKNDAREIFRAIRSLNKLKILELINIQFSKSIKYELGKCNGIKALLIIPMYNCSASVTNRLVINCLKKLSYTLTHLVWGLTRELKCITKIFLTKSSPNHNNISYDLEIPHIPIQKARKLKQQPGVDQDEYEYRLKTINVISVPAVEKLLEDMMIIAKTKVVIVPFALTTQVKILNHFKD